MKIFTVHRRETGSPPGGAAARGDDVVLVKEGFAWLGALFGPLWALAHRMWSWALVTALANTVFAVLIQRIPMNPGVQAAIAAGLFVLIGAHANDARRRSLAARGYREAAVVGARDFDSAFLRYLERAPSARASVP